MTTLCKPISNYIVAEPLYQTETAGGLALPDHVAKNQEGLVKARVLRVGPGKFSEQLGRILPMLIKPLDIIYPMGNVLKWNEGGREYWLLSEEMVMAVQDTGVE